MQRLHHHLRGEQGRRNAEAERFGRLGVYDQLEFRMTALEPLLPDRVRRVHGQPQLRALVRLGERVAAGAAGEAALRANREALRGDILRRFIDAPLQAIDRFEYRRFAADQPEHYALSLRDEA
jgi:hypothetical protein